MLKLETRQKSAPNLKAVVKVGGGRGFIVKRADDQVVITAAHCLPFFPPAHPMSYLQERTFEALLGPLGTKPTVWAECKFVDPIADIAVLSSPGRSRAARSGRRL
jgi:hypothetical protein